MAPTSNTTIKRLHRELKDLEKEDLGGMTLAPSENNLFCWKASIPGPEGSPYEGGVFNLVVELANDYPFSAPKVLFTTRIYHMNISERGSVCIDILKQNWSPALSLYKVLLSLSSLLTDPNPKDPLVPTIATEYSRNRKKHDSTARQWTRQYALPPKPSAQSDAAQTSSNKGKGKIAVAPLPSGHVSQPFMQSAQQSSRNAISQRLAAASSVVELNESDDGSAAHSAVATGKRKRAAVERSVGDPVNRRRRGDGLQRSPELPEVIVIDD